MEIYRNRRPEGIDIRERELPPSRPLVRGQRSLCQSPPGDSPRLSCCPGTHSPGRTGGHSPSHAASAT